MQRSSVAKLVAISESNVRFSAYDMHTTCQIQPEALSIITLAPVPKTRKRGKGQKSLSIRGVYQHPRSNLWYWRFTYQGRRFTVPLETSDPVQAQIAALKEQSKLFGTPERRATAEEQAAYMVDFQNRQNLKNLGKGTSESVFTPEGFILWYKNFNLAPGRHRASTVWRTASQLKNFFLRLGVKDVRQIKPQALSLWRDSTLQKASQKSPAHGLKAATSVATTYRNVRAAFSYAARSVEEGGAGILPLNPLSTWKPFSKAERKRLATERERFIPVPKLTIEEYRRLLEKAEAYPKREDGKPENPTKVAGSIAVWLMATGGLRWTEAQFARWENLDGVRHSLKLQPTEHFTTKSGKSRVVPLPAKTMEFLSHYRQRSGFILPSENVETEGIGHIHDRVSVRPHVEKIIELASFSNHISPHGLRHVYVTLCRESGIPRDAVQAAVGHSSGLITMIYDHSLPNSLPFNNLPI